MHAMIYAAPGLKKLMGGGAPTLFFPSSKFFQAWSRDTHRASPTSLTSVTGFNEPGPVRVYYYTGDFS